MALGCSFRGRLRAGAGLFRRRFGCLSRAGELGGVEGKRGGGAGLALRFEVGLLCLGEIGCKVAQRHPQVAEQAHQQQKQRPVRRPLVSRFRRLRQLQQDNLELLVRGAG